MANTASKTLTESSLFSQQRYCKVSLTACAKESFAFEISMPEIHAHVAVAACQLNQNDRCICFKMLLAQAQELLWCTIAVVMVGTQPTGSVKNSTLHMCGMTSSTTGASSRVLTVAALLYLYGLLAATLPVLSNGVMSSLHHRHAHIQSHKAGTNR